MRSKTRDEWTRIFIGTDACCVPVLDASEIDAEGRSDDSVEDGSTPAPRPVLRRTPGRAVQGTKWDETEHYYLEPGRDTHEVLAHAGLTAEDVNQLVKKGVVRCQTGAEAAELEAKAKL
jgi:alpha-methylacyl-CoA racemase